METQVANRTVKDDRNALHDQFILCRDRDQIPDEWLVHRVGQWWLGHHPSLPVVRLSDEVGFPLGWLLGWAVDDRGKLREADKTAAVSFATADELEHWIYLHGGRFVAIVVRSPLARVYLDPCGSLSVVYCAALECVASTTTVVPRVGDTADLVEETRLVGIPGYGLYPLGLTPRKNVLRLVPNHFLDLEKWQAVRHWPKTYPFAPRGVGEVVSTVADRVRLTIGGVLDERPVLLRLTAGRDSRLLLACARRFADRITFFTAEHERSDEVSWLDCSTGSRIAGDLGLSYMRLKRRPPRQEDLDEWLFRTGWSIGEERGQRALRTYHSLPPGHVDLIGLCGELGRVEHWPRLSPDLLARRPVLAQFTHDELLEFIPTLDSFPFVARHPRSASTVLEWLKEVEPYDLDLHLVHDLFYIEQRMGSWGGIFPYAYAQDGRFQLFPFSNREIFEAMLSLPVSARLNDEMGLELIRREWPELLRYPFNAPRGLQRVAAAQFPALRFSGRARRAVRHPVRSTRRILARVRHAAHPARG
jgi:hypothetical protein